MLSAILGVLIWGAPPVVWPGETWETAPPELEGVSSSVIMDVVDELRREKVPIHSLAIVRDGRLVTDLTFYPFPPGARHDIASCTKTVTALAIGLAIDQKKIPGTETFLLSQFPDRKINNDDVTKRGIRIDDLLTMRSGLFSFNEALSQMQMFQSSDFVKFCLNIRSARPAGKQFQYFSLNSHLLSAVVQNSFGKPMAEVVDENLFKKVGITDFGWPADPQGVTHGWGDLRLRSTDMARLGWLLLQGGKWRDQQVVSKEWIDEMLVPRVEVGEGRLFPKYGYQIWLNDDGFCFKGRGGQRIIGIPKKNLVIVSTAGASDAQEIDLDRVLHRLYESVGVANATRVDEAAERRWKEMLSDIARESSASDPAVPPPIGAKIDGVKFDLARNLYASHLIYRQKSASEGELEIGLPAIHRHPNLVIKIGLDGRPRWSKARHGELAAVLGHWEGDTLVVDFDELSNINHWTWRLAYTEDTVNVNVTEVTDLPTIRTTGKRGS